MFLTFNSDVILPSLVDGGPMIVWRSRRSRRRQATRPIAAAGVGLIAAVLFAAAPAHAEPAHTQAQGQLPTYGQVAAQDQLPAQAPAPDSAEVIETEYGPLGPADRDLVVRVRYAGLWEVPAGTMAAEKGSTEEIREIGAFIAEEHTRLDEEAINIAAELQVALPTAPYADHQTFLNRMDASEGEEFDREFIQRLREAHGEIYPAIAFVRAATENDMIRDFAKTAEEFVGRHMDYLEESGLVDWVQIPPAPEPHGTRSRFLSAYPAGVNPVLIWMLLGVAAVAGAITVVRTLRPR
jgi:predicted outer membrane protein